MKRLVFILVLPLCGCAISKSEKSLAADAIKAAGTSSKRIHLELDGWNTHFRYDSWPSSPTNNNQLP